MSRMGNWESRSLAAHQISYAANDVFVTYEIAKQLKKLQNLRPNQDFTLQLMTVHTNGSTTLKVGGTLQERQERPATTSDVIETTENPLSILPGKLLNDHPYAEANAIMRRNRLSRFLAPTPSAGAVKAFKYGDWKLRSSTPPTKTVPKRPSSAYSSSTDIFGLEMGGRSESVVIKAAHHNGRSFNAVGSRGLFRVTDCNSRKLDSSSIPRKETTAESPKGDIYFPSQLLPESLEDKDILERNQAVWLNAGGGRDLSEDAEVNEEEDEDWHLNQNQALFASLISPTPEDGEDICKKK